MATTTKTFAANGTWICPPGVTSIQAAAWGGGGAGGGATANNDGGGGGAGGQYAVTTSIAVAAGTSYTIVVGGTQAGGTGNGSAGNDSYFTTTGVAPTSTAQGVLAKGGAGGTANNGAGGTGSTTNGIGNTVNRGGSGSAGAASTRSGGGGGGAGSGGAGGDTTASTVAGTGTATGGGNGGTGLASGSNANGGNGNTFGGGGAGAYRTTTTNRSGGSGAAGQVQLTYTTPKTELLQDNFDSNSQNTNLWQLGGAGTPSNQVKFVNQEVEITTTGTSGNYDYMQSIETYDLTGSFVLIKVVSAGAQAANQDCVCLEVADTGLVNKLFISINSGNVQALDLVASVQNTIATISYNSSTMNWFRIRESGGTIFWDYGTETGIGLIAWTNITSLATPITITALTQMHEGGQFGAAAATTFKYDSHNMPPTIARDIQPQQNSPGDSTLQAMNRMANF